MLTTNVQTTVNIELVESGNQGGYSVLELPVFTYLPIICSCQNNFYRFQILCRRKRT